jgi:hypothetical protein
MQLFEIFLACLLANILAYYVVQRLQPSVDGLERFIIPRKLDDALQDKPLDPFYRAPDWENGLMPGSPPLLT